ncbi:MAG: hypothetical protein M1828_005865 [Chrysothrix sp. TS-e1954]|nr:MAG: hypothetical protein M1828_005865 [Chrysothrix sp. TS-e1954]
MKLGRWPWLVWGSSFASALALTEPSGHLTGSISSVSGTSDIIIELMNTSGKELSVQTIDNIFDETSQCCPLHISAPSGKSMQIAKDHARYPSTKRQRLRTMLPGETFRRKLNLLNFLDRESAHLESSLYDGKIVLELPSALVGVVDDGGTRKPIADDIHVLSPMRLGVQAQRYHFPLSQVSAMQHVPFHSEENARLELETAQILSRNATGSLERRDSGPRFFFSYATTCDADQQKLLLDAASSLPKIAYAGALAASCFAGSGLPANLDPFAPYFDRGNADVVMKVTQTMYTVWSRTTPLDESGAGPDIAFSCADDDDELCSSGDSFNEPVYMYTNNALKEGDPAASQHLSLIRVCPIVFFVEPPTTLPAVCTGGTKLLHEVPFMIFHELFHIVSDVIVDFAYGDTDCRTLLKDQTKPDSPVLNADSYAIFGYLAYKMGWSSSASVDLQQCSEAILG